MTEKPWIIVGILALSGGLGVLLMRGAPNGPDGRGPRPAQDGFSAKEEVGAEPPTGHVTPLGPGRGGIRIVRRPKTGDDVADRSDAYRIPGGPGDADFLTGGLNSRGANLQGGAEGQPELPLDSSNHAGLGRGRDTKAVQTAPDPVDPGPPIENDKQGNAPEGDPDLILSLPLDGRVEVKGDGQVFAEENLKIDETTGTVEFPSDSVLGIADAGHVRPEAGTISMEVVPRWDGSDGGDASFIQIKTPGMWQGAMSLLRNGPYLVFRFNDADGGDNQVGTEIANWKAGEAHTITATWGEALMSMYVDGELRGQVTYASDPAFSQDWPLFVGSNPLNHLRGANATLRDLRIYSRALTEEEIATGSSSP